MKKILYLVLIFPGVVLNSTAQECPGTLVHYWKLDRNTLGFADEIGGLTAQVEVAPLSVIGVVDSGQYFNGLSEISVPNDATFNWQRDASFTIEFWVRKSSVCPEASSINNNVIIGRDDPDSGLHWWAGIDCQTPGRVNFTLFSATGDGTILKTGRGIIDGNWHHIVAVRDGAQNITSVYLDSELDTSVTYVYTHGFGSLVPVNVGWINRLEGKYHLDANIDELAIHNAALSEEVISDHFNNGSGKLYCTGIGTGVPEPVNENRFSVYPSFVVSEFHVVFSLDQSSDVDITAYDVTGKKLAVLINEKLPGGLHDLKFTKELLGKNSMVLLQLRISDKVYNRKIIIR